MREMRCREREHGTKQTRVPESAALIFFRPRSRRPETMDTAHQSTILYSLSLSLSLYFNDKRREVMLLRMRKSYFGIHISSGTKKDDVGTVCYFSSL